MNHGDADVATRSKLRVLLVDDDQFQIYATSQVISSSGVFELASTASSGKEAIMILEDESALLK